mmetsp:Transcript_34095/g.61975  ORF Transcript_34095/g.61975 Transcript_34095/m.61975 type:complete len:424 (-) Transcript_34095:227-1498(-)
MHADHGVALLHPALLLPDVNGAEEDALRANHRANHLGLAVLQVAAHLPSGLLQSCVHDDGHRGAVLGYIPGSVTGVRQDHNHPGTHVQAHIDGGACNGLEVRQGAVVVQGRVAHGLVQAGVVNCVLCLAADLVHNLHGLQGEVATSSLARKHDTVSAINDSIGNIRAFSAGGTGILDHGLKHLGGSNHRLAHNVALPDHHLLSSKYLLWGDSHTQITTRNHDAICLFKDLIEVFKALVVLNLADDLDVSASLAKNLADLAYIVGSPHKGSCDEVYALDHAKTLNVVDVLLGHSGKINDCAGERHVLTLTESEGVFSPCHHRVSLDLGDSQREATVGNQDNAAYLQRLGKFGIRHGNSGGVAVGFVISDALHNGVLLNGERLVVGGETCSDLGAFGIKENANVFLRTLGKSLPHFVQHLGMALV